jgi:hypothetical protein
MFATLLRAAVGAIIAGGLAALAFVGIKLAVGPQRKCEPPEQTPGGLTPGCFPNPLICVDSEAEVRLPIGTPAVYPQCGAGPHTLVRSQSGSIGLDAGAETALRFRPTGAPSVDVVHFSSDQDPGVIEYLQGVTVVGTRPFLPTPGVLQRYAWSGSGIDRIVVRPLSTSFVTLVVMWCH